MPFGGRSYRGLEAVHVQIDCVYLSKDDSGSDRAIRSQAARVFHTTATPLTFKHKSRAALSLEMWYHFRMRIRAHLPL